MQPRIRTIMAAVVISLISTSAQAGDTPTTAKSEQPQPQNAYEKHLDDYPSLKRIKGDLRGFPAGYALHLHYTNEPPHEVGFPSTWRCRSVFLGGEGWHEPFLKQLQGGHHRR